MTDLKAGSAGTEFWSPKFNTEKRLDGSIIFEHASPIAQPDITLLERLGYWVERTPDAHLIAERDESDQWQYCSFQQFYQRCTALAQRLLAAAPLPLAPIVILAPNSIDNAVVAFAAKMAGIPYAPVSAAYAMLSHDYTRLKSISDLLRPWCIYTPDARSYEQAVHAMGLEESVWLVSDKQGMGGAQLLSDFIAAGSNDPAAINPDANNGGIDNTVDSAAEPVGFSPPPLTPDTVVKYLFTSGSTGTPKAVVNTHRMIVSNQVMVGDCYRFITREPPVIVDWAPWSHTGSGNLHFNLALYNGGCYYIDGGSPTPEGMQTTIRNLTEVSPTWYFSVPLGYMRLAEEMRVNEALRHNFFKRLDMFLYAGAPIDDATYTELMDQGYKTTGRSIPFLSSLGSTETGPAAFMGSSEHTGAGNVGVPLSGVQVKLVPLDEGFEARVKSPSLTPGYYNDAVATNAMFDSEGYYRLGDAVSALDENDLARGFKFIGRLSENFKLATGTWVMVNPLRLAMLTAFEGLLADVVVVGEGRSVISALGFPHKDFAEAVGETVNNSEDETVVSLQPDYRHKLQQALDQFAAQATGTSNRVTKLLLLREPADFDKGESTHKGSINQRAIIQLRSADVARLDRNSPDVLLTPFAEVTR